MNIRESSTLHILFYEGDGAIPMQNPLSAMIALLEKGYTATRSTSLARVTLRPRDMLVVLGEFAQGRAPSAEDATSAAKIRFHDVTGLDTEKIIGLVEKERVAAGTAERGGWKPWFPVIDYDRCTNCMQCLSFCLFGVYGVDEQNKIQVQNHDQCKTNCPACSRVCPEAAIMFPKYKAGPINGDAVSTEDLHREKMKIDISALLGGDVYSMLRARSEKAKSRFSKERDADKALGERQKCLIKLAQAGDIPAEVLASLPSAEEIARKAEEAKAKAAAALAAREKPAPEAP